MAELTSLITNTASPYVDSAVESLEAESTRQAERTDEVQQELLEKIESVQETLISQMTAKIESVQETLISRMAESASSNETQTSSVQQEFAKLVEQVRAEIAGGSAYTKGMLDIANGAIGVVTAKVELHSSQFGSHTTHVDAKMDEMRAMLASMHHSDAQPRSEHGAPGVHTQVEGDGSAQTFRLHTPQRERNDGSERGPRVHKLSLDKLGLKVLSDKTKYRTWVKSVDMALDDIWVGLEDVLRLVKSRLDPMSAEEFGGKLDECRLRPPDCTHHEWTYGFIGRYMYSVLYTMTSGDMQSIVEQCEKRKDAIEAYRLLSIHCGPTIFNMSNTLMESIMELGRRRVNSIDDLLATMREVRKRLSAYEDRVAVLPDARQTFIPSMLITLLDGEALHFVRMKQASGDFEKMVSALEEFRLIKKSSGGKGALRQMRDYDAEAEEQWA